VAKSSVLPPRGAINSRTTFGLGWAQAGKRKDGDFNTLRVSIVFYTIPARPSPSKPKTHKDEPEMKRLVKIITLGGFLVLAPGPGHAEEGGSGHYTPGAGRLLPETGLYRPA
jgi:hypothetical protein